MWRPIQTHAAADVCELLGRHAAVAGKERVGSARRELHEDEREHGDAKEQRDRFQHAARDEAEHCSLS